MSDTDRNDRLTRAYERMMERVRERLRALEAAETETLPHLRRSIEHAAEKAVELGELTREEAQIVAGYVRRDLRDAGRHLAETGSELRDWLRFDIELIEDRLVELLSHAADRTRLELLELQAELEAASHYTSGEVTGPGTLVCDRCGETLRFRGVAVIPACPGCGHDHFSRPAEGRE